MEDINVRVFSFVEGEEENRAATKKASRILEEIHAISFKNKELIPTIAIAYLQALLTENGEVKVRQDRFGDVSIIGIEDSFVFPVRTEIKTGELVYLDKTVRMLEQEDALDEALNKLKAMKNGDQPKEHKVVKEEFLEVSEKQYEIPIEITITDTIKVTASNLHEAKDIAKNTNIDISRGEFIKDSFKIHDHILEEKYPEESK